MVPPPYVPNAELELPGIEKELFADWPSPADGSGRLTVREENILFRQLHYAAYRLSKIYQSAERRRTDAREREYSEWTQRYHLIRTRVVEANQGLVYDLIGRSRFSSIDREEMTSEGMMALLRAADTFNPWKGYRFSTYACNVIARALMRRGKQESHYRKRFPVQHDVSFERPARSPDDQTELYVERLHRALDQNLGELTELESRILAQRFPAQREDRQTFQEIGDSIGLSKERVRQIQNIALGKLREALLEDPALK